MPCGYSSKSFWRHDHFHYHGKIAMVILLSLSGKFTLPYEN